jgi:hypothetical protein
MNRGECHVVFFFRRGTSTMSCETRLNPAGVGYELVITEDGRTRTEQSNELAAMLAREHELLQAWHAQGWRDVGPASSGDRR